jgi:hypothetical protein
MLTMEARTRLSQEEVVKQALKFFRSHRMNVTNQSPGCVSFEGSGGGVSISTKIADGITVVEAVSREWDFQVKDFIEFLPKRIREKG